MTTKGHGIAPTLKATLPASTELARALVAGLATDVAGNSGTPDKATVATSSAVTPDAIMPTDR
ncbi:MAG: hypothetical protein WCI74_16520, partial [Actinomycetes bacterium]